MGIAQQSTCFVINQMMVYSYGCLFIYMKVDQAADWMMTMTLSVFMAGATVAQLVMFYRSNCLWDKPLFCFITVS